MGYESNSLSPFFYLTWHSLLLLSIFCSRKIAIHDPFFFDHPFISDHHHTSPIDSFSSKTHRPSSLRTTSSPDSLLRSFLNSAPILNSIHRDPRLFFQPFNQQNVNKFAWKEMYVEAYLEASEMAYGWIHLWLRQYRRRKMVDSPWRMYPSLPFVYILYIFWV